MKIRTIKRFIFFVFLLLVLLPSLVFSFPYSPQKTVYVKTQVMSAPDETGVAEGRIWQITAQNQGESGTFISFFAENGNTPFCQVNLSGTGQVLDAEIPGAAGNVLQKQDFLFIPGYPAPCDIFPMAVLNSKALEGEVSYKVQRDIGGQKFVDEICIQTRVVSAQEATANGWLKGLAENLTDLHVIKAVNCRSGQLISLQLWPANGDWWIYEETPYRRSWQIENFQGSQ